jgi:hypothetical protein
MPRATAMWLVDNTSLTFEQIAAFCGLHVLEINAIANGELDGKLTGFDPVVAAQLTSEEIKRCEMDSEEKLVLKDNYRYDETRRLKKKYTPRAKRHDKPEAIAWLLKYYPEIFEADICRLLGTTTVTIKAIKNKTYKNYANLVPRSPVAIGLCSEAELDFVIARTKRG